MSKTFISLGSNIEEPLRQISIAYHNIKQHPQLTPLARSHVYRSAPHGPLDQPDFLNAVVAVDTALSPRDLLKALQKIESSMGRIRARRWGERCIDLDLLLYDDIEFHTSDLVIPHPRMNKRLFVLEPLIELMGVNQSIPNGSTLGQLKAECEKQTIVVWCAFPEVPPGVTK